MHNIFEEAPYNLFDDLKFLNSFNSERSKTDHLSDTIILIESEQIINQNSHKEDRVVEDKTNYITFDVIKKNESRGRKKNSDNSLYYGTCHNKYCKDNITTKFQVHYINFIVNTFICINFKIYNI